MLTVCLKKKFHLILFVFITSALSALPIVTNASTLIKEEVNDSGTVIDNFSSEGKTILRFKSKDTKGMWLRLGESTGKSDEDFTVAIARDSFALPELTQVYVQIFKLDNKFSGYRPSSSEWITTSASAGSGERPGDSVTIIESTEDSYRFRVDLKPALDGFGQQLNIHLFGSSRVEDKPWLGFNSGNGGEFLLNVDLNEVDDNFDLSQFDDLSNVPLPPAVWMFGSALIGLVGFSRRR